MTQIRNPATQKSSEPTLHVTGMACRRGGRLLFEDFDLALRDGEAIQLAGGNGRGKTTLLRTLAGLQRPFSGRVLWKGTDVHDQEGYAGDLLYVAHENALNPDLTPRENLTALIRLHGDDPSDLDAALAALGVGDVMDRPCRRLSAGQRRRAALARLRLSNAELWLLDEPAAALDAEGRTILGRLVADRVERGGSVIFTTHEPLALPGLAARTVSL